MSNRHYITVTNSNNETLFEDQILGNNEYLDETFYEKYNINVDEDGCFDKTEIKDIDEFFADIWREKAKMFESPYKRQRFINSEMKCYEEKDSEIIILNLKLYNWHHFHQIGFIYKDINKIIEENKNVTLYIECY